MPNPRLRRPCWRRLLLALVALTAGVSEVEAQEPARSLSVSYLSATAIYLDGGRQEGLAVGDRLRLVRGGETVAEVEVAFVADHSASCRVVSQLRTVQQGDLALVISRAPRQEEPSPPSSPLPPTIEERPRTPLTLTPGEPGGGPRQATPWARASGSVSVSLQQFQDGGLSGRSYDETTGRLNLRLREMAGWPLDLRVRLRSRQDSRSPQGEARSDRLYELSLTYDPPDGRFSLQLGRLGAGPFISIGYLDGAVGQVRLGQGFYFGGFFGARPVIEELGLSSTGSKYGAFVRYSSRPGSSPRYAEVVLAGVGEYESGSVVSREYLALESRLGSGGKWSIFQRAELDLARQWEEPATAQESQLSALSLSGFYRFSNRVRASLSYDQRRNYRTADTREIPEELFDNLLRQGLRAGFHFGRPGGWQASTTFGARSREGGSEPTYSVGLSLLHGNAFGRRLLLGGDASIYSGGTAEGYVVSLRARKDLGRGHDVGLTVGTSRATLTDPLTAGALKERVSSWVRLSGTLQLPRRFFLVAEAEQDFGDDLDGQRFILEIGYRF